MLAADLRLEYKVRAALCKGIELCEQHKDYVSREMLRIQLNDTEEDHTYWLEKQLGLIKLIGLENYLQSHT
jgi:bacterioferritin